MRLTLVLITLKLVTCGAKWNHTTTSRNTIIGECLVANIFMGKPHVLCNVDNTREGVLSLIEALNTATYFCSNEANKKYKSLEQCSLPSFEKPEKLSVAGFRRCVYPNGTYSNILKHLNIDVDYLPKFEIYELMATPPLHSSLFDGLRISALRLSYSELNPATPRLSNDMTDYISTLKEFHLVGGKLSPLPNNSVLETMILDSGRSRGPLGGCSKLCKLSLINWDVHSLAMDEGWLSSCFNLTELNLHSPSMDTIYRVLTNASNLRKLEISKLPKMMYEIDIGVTKALYLETVKIHKTSIYRLLINSPLPSVADLDISDNALWNPYNLHSSLLHARLLTNLTLSNNPEMDLCFSEPNGRVDPWEITLSNMQRLVASRTGTSKLCFENLQAPLILLDLSRCNITELEFSRLPRWNTKPLELRVDHNFIERVSFTDDVMSPAVMSLRQLHLQGNRIQNFTATRLPDSLKYLDLSLNHISYIDNVTASSLFSSKERRVKLSGNSIVCDCPNQAFLGILKENSEQVEDYDKLVCKEDSIPIENITVSTLCDVTEPPQLPLSRILLPSVFAVVGLAVLIIAVFFRYGKAFKIYLYARGFCLYCLKEERLDENRPFDVFISFSHDDEEYVLNELLPLLEKDKYKTCVHMRDWIPGEWIPKQISVSIDISRRTLIVLSKSFVKSVWGMLEFRMAHASMLSEGRARMIVVVVDDITKMEDLDPELKGYLRTNTYLETSDPWFWDKLRFALPRRGRVTLAEDVPNDVRRDFGPDIARDFGPYAAILPVVQRSFDSAA